MLLFLIDYGLRNFNFFHLVLSILFDLVIMFKTLLIHKALPEITLET